MDTKSIEFFSLKEGDEIEATNGRRYEFIKFGRKNFIGKRDGHLYRVPQIQFREIISRAPIVIKENWQDKLKENDYFYIVERNKCSVFIFKGMSKGKIIAKNVHNDIQFIISNIADGGRLPL